MKFDSQEVDDWFSALDEAFKGKLPEDHPLIRTYRGRGWRVRTMGADLVLLADEAFPYSKPQAYVENYDRSRPNPHIEPRPNLGQLARICLSSQAIPHSPLQAIMSAVNDARELLKANLDGEEDADFENDFAAYWQHYLPTNARKACIFGLTKAAIQFGNYAYVDKTYYCFPNKVTLRRWSRHRSGGHVREPHRFPIVELQKFPRPNHFPNDPEALIAILENSAPGSVQRVGDLLRAGPTRLPIIFCGTSAGDRRFAVGTELIIRTDQRGRRLCKAREQSRLSDEDVFRLYDVSPLNTQNLEAAHTRLADGQMIDRRKKVMVVGCGALGSGISKLLAKSGISRIVLVDPDRLGWENIRRHELGAEGVNFPKASALKAHLERSIPDIEEVSTHTGTIQQALGAKRELFNDVDLVIAATGDWAGDVFLNDMLRGEFPAIPVLYTWTEAFGLAAHAVLISGGSGRLTDGFDANGSFKGMASKTARIAPPECGNDTSPFGAIEVAQAQALAARLALEWLNGHHEDADVWRTWTTEQSTLESAEGQWTEYWLAERGQPPTLGGISEGKWAF